MKSESQCRPLTGARVRVFNNFSKLSASGVLRQPNFVAQVVENFDCAPKSPLLESCLVSETVVLHEQAVRR